MCWPGGWRGGSSGTATPRSTNRLPTGGWSARIADLPVFAAGDTREEAEEEVRGALALYLEQLAADGEPAPPASAGGTVAV